MDLHASGYIHVVCLAEQTSLSIASQSIALSPSSEPFREKSLCFLLHANNKDADQTAHLHDLVNVIVVCL